jgi:hypothetical protein
MAKSQNIKDIARTDWTFSTDDQFTYTQIQTAAMLHAAQQAERAANILYQILGRLDSLGNDGLHEILRHERTRIRKSERLRKAKIAAKRRRTIAAKKAAAQP